MESYSLGQTVRITTGTAFTDADGAAVDPDTVTLTILQPDGTEVAGVTPTNDPDAVGSFYYDLTADQSGEYVYQWSGVIGSTTAVDHDRFWIWPDPTA